MQKTFPYPIMEIIFFCFAILTILSYFMCANYAYVNVISKRGARRFSHRKLLYVHESFLSLQLLDRQTKNKQSCGPQKTGWVTIQHQNFEMSRHQTEKQKENE